MHTEREIPWIIQEQTKLKHQLLGYYIKQWMAILYRAQEKGRYLETLLYFDGFSGPGVYWKDEHKKSTVPGSPIIVAQLANKFLDAKPERQFIIFAIDKNQVCVEMTNERFKKINKHNQLWIAHHAEFEDAVNSLFDRIERDDLHRPPMFIFIDPFGYSGFTMNTLKRLMRYPRVELFVTLMIYEIVRWYTSEEKEERMYDLFGCWDFKEALSFSSPEQRQLFLKNLYCRELNQSANAKFVMPFRINTPEQSTRPRYYLIHASNHIKALRVMKDSMFRFSEDQYSFKAIGLLPDQFQLFEDPGKIELKQRILIYCKDCYPKSLDFDEVEHWAYINTNGVSRTIKRSLIELEDNELIKITRKPRQRKSTVTKGAKIVYLDREGVQK